MYDAGFVGRISGVGVYGAGAFLEGEGEHAWWEKGVLF